MNLIYLADEGGGWMRNNGFNYCGLWGCKNKGRVTQFKGKLIPIITLGYNILEKSLEKNFHFCFIKR